jgi:Spy/CpxP family protein refolding chaperone
MVLPFLFSFVLAAPALAQERSGGPAGQQPPDPQALQALRSLQDRLNQAPGARGGGARGVPLEQATSAYLRELERFVNKANGPVIVSVTAGAWWTNSALVTQLGLTDDQKAKIEKSFENHRLSLEADKTQLEREEAQLARLLEAEPVDRNATQAQIYRVVNARGEMERTNALMTLEMREYLTRAQWTQLQNLTNTTMHILPGPPPDTRSCCRPTRSPAVNR